MSRLARWACAAALGFVAAALLPGQPARAQTFSGPGYSCTTSGTQTNCDYTGGGATFNSRTGAISGSVGSTSYTGVAIPSATRDSVTVTGIRLANGASTNFTCQAFSNGQTSGDCTGIFIPGFSPSAPVDSATLQRQIDSVVASSTDQLVRSQTRIVDNIVSSRVRGIALNAARALGSPVTADAGGRGTGLAAGDPPQGFGVFFDGSGSYISNDRRGGDGQRNDFEGASATGLFGIDYTFGGRWVLGFTGGYQYSNLALNALNGDRRSDGALFGPYAAYVLNEHYTIDAHLTYTTLITEMLRRQPGAGAVRASFISDRYAGSANFNAAYDFSGFNVSGFVGYSYAREEIGRYTDSAGMSSAARDVSYGAARLGGEAGYPFANGLEPYVTATFEYETTRPENNANREAVIVGGGLRYTYSDTISAGLVATTQQAREGEEIVTVGANVRMRF